MSEYEIVYGDNRKSYFKTYKAAKEGNFEAQYYLALYFYENSKNKIKAYYWAKLAANKNNVLAQLLLGDICSTFKDYAGAYHWYYKAADEGCNAIAKYRLAEFYENGIYVKEDLEKAYYWYKQASMQNPRYGTFEAMKLKGLVVNNFEESKRPDLRLVRLELSDFTKSNFNGIYSFNWGSFTNLNPYFTVVIGDNNSGKTSFLNLISLQKEYLEYLDLKERDEKFLSINSNSIESSSSLQLTATFNLNGDEHVNSFCFNVNKDKRLIVSGNMSNEVFELLNSENNFIIFNREWHKDWYLLEINRILENNNFKIKKSEEAKLLKAFLNKLDISDVYALDNTLSKSSIIFTYLAVLLLQKNPPLILLIDDIENGLNPTGSFYLNEIINFASKRTQIIATTYSTELIDSLEYRDATENIFYISKGSLPTNLDRRNWYNHTGNKICVDWVDGHI